MNDDDDVIDLTRYLDRDTPAHSIDVERGSFAVFGGEGDRSRFALPVWRSIYLTGSRRGALVKVPRGGEAAPKAEFVLDLGSDPARVDFSLANAGAADSGDPPMVLETAESTAVFLGTRDEDNWFLLLDDYGPAGAADGYSREELLFLAGECAGLLFFRELAEAGDKLDGK